MYSKEQIRIATSMFAGLFFSKLPNTQILSEIDEATAPYSADAEQYDDLTLADSFHDLVKTKFMARLASIQDHDVHELRDELILILENALLRENATKPSHVELMSSTQAYSPTVRAALERLQIKMGYVEWPRVNICLYSDGELHLYDRDDLGLKALPYEGKPDVLPTQGFVKKVDLHVRQDFSRKFESKWLDEPEYHSEFYFMVKTDIAVGYGGQRSIISPDQILKIIPTRVFGEHEFTTAEKLNERVASGELTPVDAKGAKIEGWDATTFFTPYDDGQAPESAPNAAPE